MLDLDLFVKDDEKKEKLNKIGNIDHNLKI